MQPPRRLVEYMKEHAWRANKPCQVMFDCLKHGPALYAAALSYQSLRHALTSSRRPAPQSCLMVESTAHKCCQA